MYGAVGFALHHRPFLDCQAALGLHAGAHLALQLADQPIRFVVDQDGVDAFLGIDQFNLIAVVEPGNVVSLPSVSVTIPE